MVEYTWKDFALLPFLHIMDNDSHLIGGFTDRKKRDQEHDQTLITFWEICKIHEIMWANYC